MGKRRSPRSKDWVSAMPGRNDRPASRYPYAFPVTSQVRPLRAQAASIQASEPGRCAELLGLLDAGMSALDPERAVARVLTAHPPPGADVVVLALGKAASAMARGAAAALGRRARMGLVVSDHPEPVPEGAELLVTCHPLPGLSSVEAGRRLLEAVAAPGDHIVFLVSGGGSALAEVPRAGIGLEELVVVYDLLLREGVAIEEANIVRCHLSALKGGRLAAAAAAPITTVVLSDVGPRLDLVASGPTVAPPSRPGDAVDVLRRHGLVQRTPPAVLKILAGDDEVQVPAGTIIPAGDGGSAAEAVIAAGRDVGLPVSMVTTSLSGESADAARHALESVPAGAVGVLAGETTVTVRGSGRGGRNQEAALAAALAVDGGEGAFVALGTDGVDGPTDAAGAYVDASTAQRMRAAGIDPPAALERNDSHTALAAAGALIRTGPTGVNVADLWMVDRR